MVLQEVIADSHTGGSEGPSIASLSNADVSPQQVVEALQSVAKGPTQLDASSSNQEVFDTVGRWSISDEHRRVLVASLPDIVQRACKDGLQEVGLSVPFASFPC